MSDVLEDEFTGVAEEVFLPTYKHLRSLRRLYLVGFLASLSVMLYALCKPLHAYNAYTYWSVLNFVIVSFFYSSVSTRIKVFESFIRETFPVDYIGVWKIQGKI